MSACEVNAAPRRRKAARKKTKAARTYTRTTGEQNGAGGSRHHREFVPLETLRLILALTGKSASQGERIILGTSPQLVEAASGPKVGALIGPPVSRARQRRIAIRSFRPGPGYRKLACGRCGKHARIGPLQWRYLTEHPGHGVLCMFCFKPGPGEIMAPLGGLNPGGDYQMLNGRCYGPNISHNGPN